MQELFEKYPQAAEVIVEYYTEVFKKSIEDSDVDEEYKEYARQAVNINNEYVATMLEITPRGAFDVFDANSIFISVKYGVDGFTWHITQLPFSEIKDTTVYTFRKEAEVKAVEKAFEILNEKLCQTK